MSIFANTDFRTTLDALRRGRAILLFALAIALALGLAPAGALAQSATAGNPDAAVNAGKSGDEWFRQAEKPNWRVSDKISPGMSQILQQALLDFSAYEPEKGCKSAAANTAWNALADVANAGPLDAFLEAIKESLKGIWKVATFAADPSGFPDLLEPGKLVDDYIETLEDEAKDAAKQKVKDKVEEIWKGKPVEVLKRTASRGGCDTTVVAIWDRATSSYEITIYGNCRCNAVPQWGGGRSVKLRTFAVQLKGKVTPGVTDDGMVLYVGTAKITLSAKCDCAQPGTTTKEDGKKPNDDGPGITDGGGGITIHDGDFWRKLTTKCAACQGIVDKIRGVQDQRDNMDRDFRQLQGDYDMAVRLGDAEKAAALKERIGKQTERERALIKLQEGLYAQLKACEAENCKPGACDPKPDAVPPCPGKTGNGKISYDENRETILVAIQGFRTGQADSSGTMVALPFGDYRDISDDARDDAAQQLEEAERLRERRRNGLAAMTAAQGGTGIALAPTSGPVVMPPITSPEPMLPTMTTAPAPSGIAGTYMLQDVSSGVSRVTIRRQSDAFVLSGMGPDILLEQNGNSYVGGGAVLFGKGGHQVRLTPQGSQLALSASNSSGGSFATVMRR